jgi:hypothetical protein
MFFSFIIPYFEGLFLENTLKNNSWSSFNFHLNLLKIDPLTSPAIIENSMAYSPIQNPPNFRSGNKTFEILILYPRKGWNRKKGSHLTGPLNGCELCVLTFLSDGPGLSRLRIAPASLCFILHKLHKYNASLVSFGKIPR